jgi:hypothetical protein
MNPHDFLYIKVRNGCLKIGISQTGANNAATQALYDFRRGKFSGKASKLIEESIKSAKKLAGANIKRR